MPTIKRPRTDDERDTALRTAKNRKDAVPPPLIIPFTTATITRLDTFQPQYRTKFLAVLTTKNTQTQLTAQVETARQQGIYYVQDFIENLNRAIRRGDFEPTVRTLYNITVNDSTTPVINTEAELTTWGENINAGETARIAAGGTPITFPSLAQVNTVVGNFNTLNNTQANAKEAYDTAQEELSALNTEADKLILKLWNEIETAFNEGNKASMRRKAREWGVVYTVAAGETLNPEEFSIAGTITDSATGNPIANAVVHIVEPDVFAMTDNLGKYYVLVLDPGTYSLEAHKSGYMNHQAGGIVVTGTEVVILDIQLHTGVLFEGTISPGQTIAINTTGIVFTPTTILQLEAEGSIMQFSFSTNPGDTFLVPWAENNPGQLSLVTASDIGLNPSRMQLQVKNVGIAPGTYKITIAQ